MMILQDSTLISQSSMSESFSTDVLLKERASGISGAMLYHATSIQNVSEKWGVSPSIFINQGKKDVCG